MSLAEALAAHEAGRMEEAERLYRACLAQSEEALALGNLGVLLTQRGRAEEALALLRRAEALEPDRGAHAANLGIALSRIGRTEEALAAFSRAEGLEPSRAIHPFNAGRALALAGRHEEAVAAARRALALDPAHAGARYNLALALLRLGRWREAWPHYEARFLLPEGPAVRHPQLPWWRGEALEGKVLLYADQGFGDTLMMVRFLPLLAQRGCRVVLQVEEGLHRLLAASLPGIALVGPGPAPEGVVAKAALLSLPGLLDLAETEVPARVPYLQAPPDPRLDVFFAALNPGPRVALAWRGNPSHLQDAQRSMDPALFAPLGRIPGVQWLAFNPGAKELPPLQGIRDLGAEVHDFAEGAAALGQVDLLISVDSAPAHLAGALGRPVLLLLPFVPDWRWMTRRSDSPWYPTLEIRRQERPGDWSGLVEKLAIELS